MRARFMAALFLLALPILVMAETAAPLPELESRPDSSLQAGLEAVLADQGLADAVARGDLAVALAVVTVPGDPRLAMVNGHRMLYAASLPKIAILLGAADALETGRMKMNPALDQDLNAMIRTSCNDCATRVLAQVGRDELLSTLQAPRYGFYDVEADGGLWVGKDYGPAQAYQRDPLTGLSHGATAYQAARFYYLLHNRALVSPTQSELMLSTLVDPALSHKFVKNLQGLPGVRLYRKSGTWKDYHSDSVLVRYAGHAYILVALSRHPNGERWLQNMALPLHQLAVQKSWETVQAAQ